MTPCQLVTDLGQLPVRPATPEDVPPLMDLFREVRQWLCARGWSKEWEWIEYPNLDEYLLRWVNEHAVYVAELDGTIIATLTLDADDEPMWGERGQDGRALYMKKMATSRAAAGRGLGRALVDFAIEMARAQGRTLVRLDCLADDADLCRYYERLGFAPVGERLLTHRDWRAALYERPAEA
jgi:GNAT superfamily N-acetyltransferase